MLSLLLEGTRRVARHERQGRELGEPPGRDAGPRPVALGNQP
jgi:hypothetical protein